MHFVDAKGILTGSGGHFGMNIYRGCSHGCNECVRVGVKGIVAFGMGLTLREGDREYYYAALDRYFPGMKERYIREYGNSYELPSPNEKELLALMRRTCRENDILCTPKECFAYMDELPDKYGQMSIFDFIGTGE